MGLFSSKTKYYVSSSSFPIFDDVNRANQYLAGILDYTANAEIDQADYFNYYYSSSRLPFYRGLLNWWEQQGNFDTFGKITAKFYGAASLDNSALTEGVKQYVELQDTDAFSVYDAYLSYFSEDFWIKHLASQQGYADRFYEDSELDYEIDYPSDGVITATFSDGLVISGSLPNYTTGTRFLNISWSILRTTTSVTTEEDGTKITTTSYKYIYGYYCYQENSGNSILDEIMSVENTRTDEDDAYSFLPVVPLRTNTAWYSEPEYSKISDAIERLQIFSSSGISDYYAETQDMLVDCVSDGSINDIDYITLILGVFIGSSHQSDLKYMYEFFYGLHTNYNLRNGVSSTVALTPKNIDTGEGNWINFVNDYLPKVQTNNTYNTFTINCSSSNLNYTYEWDGSDYFECNGQFKPDVSTGDYGILSGQFTYTWEEKVPATDAEGQLIYTRPEGSEDGWELKYETITNSTDYSLTLFCYQYSSTRWRFVAFVNLGLINLIYHGKTIYTSAHSGIIDASGTDTVTHDFSLDLPAAPGNRTKFTFTYATVAADGNNPFIVPLEQNTYLKIGARDAMEIAYGCQFIVCNCWESKKVKWYQRGVFSVFAAFVGVVLTSVVSLICPTIGGIATLYWGFALTATFTALQLNLILKVFTTIFGESLGTSIYNTVKTVVLAAVCYICMCIPVIGWAIAASVMFTVTAAETINNGGSLWDAFKNSMVAGGITAVGGYFAATPSATSTVAIDAGGTSTVGLTQAESWGLVSFGSTASTSLTYGAIGMSIGVESSLANGGSIGNALLSGVISGGMAAIGTYVGLGSAEAMGKDISAFTTRQAYTGFLNEVKNKFSTVFNGKIWTNPNTYEKLISMAQDERYYHKLANLASEYNEFNDDVKAAADVLEFWYQQQSTMMTAQLAIYIQQWTCNLQNSVTEVISNTDPDSFITSATITGTDFCNNCLMRPSMFCYSKLSEQGNSPDKYYWASLLPDV